MVLEEGDEVCLLGRGGELDGVLDEDGSGLSAGLPEIIRGGSGWMTPRRDDE